MERVKNDLVHTISDKPVGYVRLYKLALNHFNQDEAKTDAWLLSPDGGFTYKQLKRIKYLIKNRKERYRKEKAYSPS